MRLSLIGLAVLAVAGISGPVAAMRVPAAGPYAHALRMAAQRDAFWHAHQRFGRRSETNETSARKADYWQAQLRGRALGSAFAAE